MISTVNTITNRPRGTPHDMTPLPIFVLPPPVESLDGEASVVGESVLVSLVELAESDGCTKNPFRGEIREITVTQG